MVIHIKRNEQVFGPYSLEEVRGYLASGRVVVADFVQVDGRPEWVPLGTIPDFATPPPPPTPEADDGIEQGRDTTADGLRIGAIFRDVMIVTALTAIGGFIVGVSTRGQITDPRFALGVALSNVLLGTVGFTISGCLAPHRLWDHLLWVALGVWVVSLMNVAFFGTTIVQWLVGLLILLAMMAVGGGLSLLFRRRK